MRFVLTTDRSENLKSLTTFGMGTAIGTTRIQTTNQGVVMIACPRLVYEDKGGVLYVGADDFGSEGPGKEPAA